MSVNATDLAIWAKLTESQGTLPKLVRRLIHASVSGIKRNEFRAGEGVSLGGWDGIVDVEEGNEFVPNGISGWELGTGEDVKGKADDDYEKRTSEPLGLAPLESTFVFVTPRRWGNKTKWAEARREEKKWQNVRAYDADNLEHWLECAPAVDIWLAIELGKNPEDVIDGDSFWRDWSSSTRPNASPDLVLAGREETTKIVHSWIEDPSRPLILKGESRAESAAVFSAAVQKLGEDRRIEVLSRIAIVPNVESWNRLASTNQRLILVRNFEGPEEIGRAVRQKHGIVILLGHSDTATANVVKIPRISGPQAASALKAMGVTTEKIGYLAGLARRSLIALRRRISVVPEVERPKWAGPATASSLLAALFAGRWSAACEADRNALAELAGKSYDEVRADHVRWSNEDDPPFRRVGEAWYLTSEEDAWLLLARYVTREDLERFERVVVGVLGTADPAFDLEENKRWMASVLGHKLPHSRLLRTGLANTLAILGARSESLETTENSLLSHCAMACVRTLLATNDWKVWASLPLRQLAEAAPDEFLNALDRALDGEQPALLGLFGDEKDDLFSSPSHTELLWALETLAWNENYLLQVTSSFGRLAQLDPGGRWANRPDSSLHTIFTHWNPQTCATLERRLAAIDRLRVIAPKIAWNVMKSLLPKQMEMQVPSARPVWRDWAPEEDMATSRDEQIESAHAVVERMIKDCGSNGSRLGDLVESLHHLPRSDYDAVMSYINSIDPQGMEAADSASFFNTLRSRISRHRSHPDAKWSISEAELEPLAVVLARFEPKQPLHRFCWLFSFNPELPEGRDKDWKKYQSAVASRQRSAVETLFKAQETEWLPEFLQEIQRPEILGVTLAQCDFADLSEDDLLREYLRPDRASWHAFAAGFIGQKVYSVGLDWAKEKIASLGRKWSADQVAAFCVCLHFNPETWNIVEDLGHEVSRYYWTTVPARYVEPEHVQEATQRLMENGRPDIALFLSHLHLEAQQIEPTLIADALEQFVHATGTGKSQRRLSPYELGELLDYCSESGSLEDVRLARLEWTYMPLLGRHDYTPKILQRELARSPEFFAQVVAMLYRAKGVETQEASEDDRARAQHAYHLLESWRWRPLPGMPEDGDIDPKAIRDWVIQAREILRNEGRLAVGDQTIGQVLSAAPSGDDGVWPHPCIRDLIEDLKSDDFEQGLFIGLLNSEGVTSRKLDDGGAQERQRAEEYERCAHAVSGRWGRTAAMLRRLSGHFQRRAQDEDQRAELRRDLE